MIENVFEALLIFLMLYISLITFQSRIKDDIRYYLENFLYFHSIVDINYLCNKSTGNWIEIRKINLTSKYFLKIKNGTNKISYYYNGKECNDIEDCNLPECKWIGLPVILVDNGKKYHAIIYRCIK